MFWVIFCIIIFLIELWHSLVEIWRFLLIGEWTDRVLHCILYHVYDVVVKKVYVRYLISWWVSCYEWERESDSKIWWECEWKMNNVGNWNDNCYTEWECTRMYHSRKNTKKNLWRRLRSGQILHLEVIQGRHSLNPVLPVAVRREEAFYFESVLLSHPLAVITVMLSSNAPLIFSQFCTMQVQSTTFLTVYLKYYRFRTPDCR